jgi:uncharacterized coiled-coil protein SlyX
VRRLRIFFRGTIVTDAETITKQQAQIEKLKKQVARLKKRLLEKKAFEHEDLVQRGATPQFIQKIDAKDREALSE